jgi:hypothetical protein
MSVIEQRKQHEAKAQLMWNEFNASEKHGVRFGLFPNKQMEQAASEGFNQFLLVCALMDCAGKNGGMIA